MTNLEKWRSYTRDLTSPDSFINMSFYYMINACLQRRVWTGPAHYPLFPHMYMILVGNAAVGKGLILKTVGDFLKFWKYKDLDKPDDIFPLECNRTLGNSAREDMIDNLMENPATQEAARNMMKEASLLFPMAADATTYQALIKSIIKSVRRINIPKDHPMAPSGIYTYKSISFLLEEASSLFEKNAHLTCQFLLNAFDAGDYKYETIGRGEDIIKRMSMSILAGTVPDFIQETFKSKLLTNGFASRTIFVFEFTPRFYRYGISELNEEQRQHRIDILMHMKKLGRLFGNVTIESDAMEYLKNYFEVELQKPSGRVNPSLKLDSYYGRKNVHLPKLAMAVHFADRTDLVLTLQDVIIAKNLLDGTERKMHYALNYGGENPLASVGKNIIKYLRTNSPATFRDIWIEFVDSANEQGIRECLRYAIQTGLVQQCKIKTAGSNEEEAYEYITT